MLAGYAITNYSYCGSQYYYKPLDDGRMTETCCGNNIKRGGEELLP
jgi:hypothetical protein